MNTAIHKIADIASKIPIFKVNSCLFATDIAVLSLMMSPKVTDWWVHWTTKKLITEETVNIPATIYIPIFLKRYENIIYK